eukprot:2571825-Pyramimonas_sp.AAC.1
MWLGGAGGQGGGRRRSMRKREEDEDKENLNHAISVPLSLGARAPRSAGRARVWRYCARGP